MDWEKQYCFLFNRITDAPAQLAQRNCGAAETILKEAQQNAKNAYMEADEKQ